MMPDQECTLLVLLNPEALKNLDRGHVVLWTDFVRREHLYGKLEEFTVEHQEPALSRNSQPYSYHQTPKLDLSMDSYRVPLFRYSMTLSGKLVYTEVVQEERMVAGGKIIFLELVDAEGKAVGTSYWNKEQLDAISSISVARKNYPQLQRSCG